MAEWTVLKMGGSLQGAGLEALAGAIAWCQQRGRHVVVVHGGGPRISQALKDAGIDLPFVNGERVTTPEAMAVVEQVLAHDINRELTERLRSAGIDAVGLSGADGVLEAAPLPGRGRTARVGHVNTEAIEQLAAEGHVPVLAPLGFAGGGAAGEGTGTGGADDDGTGAGRTYNINADLAAGALAGALGAERVVFLTDVPGIYENFEAKELLTDTSADHLQHLLHAGRFHSGMIPKVTAVLSALAAGVESAFVVDGADAIALLWAVGSRGGGGIEEYAADAPRDGHRALGTRVQMERAG